MKLKLGTEGNQSQREGFGPLASPRSGHCTVRLRSYLTKITSIDTGEDVTITVTVTENKSSSADEILERDVTYHLIWLLIYH